MNPDPIRGCSWYLGAPAAGKTYLALRHARTLAQLRKVPVVVIDSTGGILEYPQVRPDQLPAAVWGKLRRSVRVVPQDDRDVERVCAMVYAGKDAVLLVDEAGFWLSAHARAGSLLRCVRAWRHGRLDVLLTTQAFSADVPQSALACATCLYLFKQTSPASMDRLGRMGVDAWALSSLPLRKFRRHVM